MTGAAVLMLGHGSRVGSANGEFESFVARYRGEHPDPTVTPAYVELGSPSLEEAPDGVARSAAKVIVVPAPLLAAEHVKNAASRRAAARQPGAEMSDEVIATPRIVVAGTASGVGKTTTVVALAAALRARGLRVATFKCGPDYLDPTYHARVTGRPSQNLDGWMMGHDTVLATFARGSADADVALVEGVMGLFDGVSPASEEGSTAEIAKWLAAPVLLCVDVSGMARTVAAVAAGFRSFDPALDVAGIVAVGVGSRGHLDLLREACPDPPIVGGLPKRPDLAFPERHLGLRRADSESVPDALLEAWRDVAAEWLGLDAILALARSAPAIPAPRAKRASRRSRCRIGVATDAAFHFYYEQNLALLEGAGADLVTFSPIADRERPRVDGVYLGGGYPELHAAELAANRTMLDSLRAFAEAGGPIYAECGGLMYLCESIRALDGTTFPMASILPGVIVMRDRLQALGYVDVVTLERTILGPPGIEFRGHQFRYSERIEPERSGTAGARLGYRVRRRRGGTIENEGLIRNRVLGSYIHGHWGSNPSVAEGFVDTCANWRTTETG